MATDNQRLALSLKERDRRYTLLREKLRDRKVDCAIASGSNLFYLTNGLPGERYGLFPAKAELGFTVFLHRRHLADLSAQVLIDAQDWVKEIRSFVDASPLIERLKELHLDTATIGVTGSTAEYGGLSHGLYAALESELPSAEIVDVSDIFTDARTLKSEEEIRLIDKANRIFDAAILRIHDIARPGMSGADVTREGIKAMWAAGGDTDSGLSFNFGPVPAQNPILADLCTDRPVQAGDIGTLTAHAHYAGYGGHSDQEISFGDPKPLHKEMFQAVLRVREAVLKKVKAGVNHSDLEAAYKRACSESGFRSSVHSQIHQYGIDIPEFPGPSYALRSGDGAERRRGRRDFVLQSGMVYSISPTVVANDGDDTLLGGTSLVVTENGYRELGDRKVELLVNK